VENTEGELHGRDREQAWERGDFDTKCRCENIEEVGCVENVSAYGIILTCISYVWTHTTNKAGHLLTGRISVKLQCTKQLVP
jgi:hypothetical protein